MTTLAQSFPAEDQSAASALSEADMDRFAMLFSPATPPATPTLVPTDKPPRSATARPRRATQSSSDSEFGAFISVPASQDPLARDSHFTGFIQPHPVSPGNHSLIYFDQFTATAKTAVARNKREVLDELLQHQDDPMYFLDTHTNTTASSVPPLTTSSHPNSSCSAVPIPIPVPMSTDDALADALASDMPNPKLIRVECGGSVKVAPSPSRSRLPLPPFLSGNASPPSTSSPSASTTSLPSTLLTSSPPSSTYASTSTLTSTSASGSSTYPAHATLSRISSSLVSLLPSNRPHSRAQTHPAMTPSSAPSNTAATARSHPTNTLLTHGSPFSSTPYVPPTGAPGFAGDRAWDRGFSDVLTQEEKRGLVDPVGLGPAHARHAKGKGVTLTGRREGTARVLTEDMANLIRPYLPALTKLPRSWTLLYSLDQHGISLNTLYARCEPCIPSRAHPNPPKGGLLVIQDAYDAVFGAWMSEGIRLEKGGYHGSGESFLWRYHPPVNGEHGEGQLDVYKWTGINDYVALCEPGFISFGGGDGHYGLYIDASLLDGSSAPCPTFGNPPLCSSAQGSGGVARTKGEVAFECVGLEVWGIGDDHRKTVAGGVGV